jgi:L-lactate dehydrogenase (cytochrome)
MTHIRSRSTLKRRLPDWREVARFVGPALRPGRSRVERVLSVEEFRQLAMRRVPRSVFDYVDGAAEQELGLAREIESFRRVVFHPHVLRDVSKVDISSHVLGRPVRFPVVLGPTGFTRMMHAAGEVAVARAASRAGIPYVLSTLGTTSPARLRVAAPEAELWYQLYVSRDRGRSKELLAQATAAKFSALVLTVDVPVSGNRWRDTRNGLTFPPTLTLRTLADMARKPAWLLDVLTTEPLAFESLGEARDLTTLFGAAFDPSVTVADVEWLRGEWQGRIVVKGVQRIDDLKDVIGAGADAVALSNHGGRQLDHAAPPLDLLPAAVDAAHGEAEIFLDGGVRSASDVAAVLALGAKGAFVARPYLYALMAAGEQGVDRYLAVLSAELERTMQILGAATVGDLTGDLVELLPPTST